MMVTPLSISPQQVLSSVLCRGGRLGPDKAGSLRALPKRVQIPVWLMDVPVVISAPQEGNSCHSGGKKNDLYICTGLGVGGSKPMSATYKPCALK